MTDRTSTDAFAALLRRLRREAGLTQEGLAERAHLSPRSVRNFERDGGSRPSEAASLLLADALGLAGGDRDAFFALIDREETQGGRHAAPPPAPADALLGREEALAALLARLADPAARVLTLVGPGGVGKTRLALEAANRLAAAGVPVAWAPLEALSAPEQVLPAVARAVGASGQSQVDPLRRIADALADHDAELLLLVDNCEHVIDAARDLARALEAAPGLRILATSREALRIGGEERVAVAPLPLPDRADDDARAAASPAVALFLDRARLDAAALPDARRAVLALDGLPLAIELAAAQVDGMSLPIVASLLDSAGLDLLAGGRRDAHARLQSMDDAVRWSHDLLREPERRLLRVLSVFRGGIDLGLLGRACERLGDPALMRGLPGLLRASLVSGAAGAEDGPRVRMLSPIRLFAEAELQAAGEAEAAEAAHLATMLEFARAGFAGVMGPEPLAALAAMDRERDNLAVALDRAIRAGNARDALALAAAMSLWWEARGEFHEGIGWLERVLALDLAAADPDDVSLAGRLAALFLFLLGRFDRCEEVVALLARAAEDASHPAGIGIAETWLGDLAWYLRDDRERALVHFRRAVGLLEPGGETTDFAQACDRLGDFLTETGDAEAALPWLRRSVAIRRARGNLIYLPLSLSAEAAALAMLGRAGAARAGFLETARAAAGLLPVPTAYALYWLAIIDAAGPDAGRQELAALLIGAADAILGERRVMLDPTMAPRRDGALADLAAALGEAERDRLLAEGRALGEGEALELAGTGSEA